MATTPGSGGLEFDPAAAGGAGGSTTRGSVQGTQVQGARVCMLVCLQSIAGRTWQTFEGAVVRRMHSTCRGLETWYVTDKGCDLLCQTAGATAGGGYSGPPKLVIFGGKLTCISAAMHRMNCACSCKGVCSMCWISASDPCRTLVRAGNGFVGSRVTEEAVKSGVSVVSISRRGQPPPGVSAPWTSQVEWAKVSI